MQGIEIKNIGLDWSEESIVEKIRVEGNDWIKDKREYYIDLDSIVMNHIRSDQTIS